MSSNNSTSPQGGPSSAEGAHLRSSSSSIASTRYHQHAPLNPSGLRESHFPSPSSDTEEHPSESHQPAVEDDGIHPVVPDNLAKADSSEQHAEVSFHAHLESNVRTRLLTQKNWDQASGCGSENCQHGTFSPRPPTHRSYGSIESGPTTDEFGRYPPDSPEPSSSLLAESIGDTALGIGHGNKRNTTRYLAQQHGIKDERMMYLEYYVPIIKWAKQYKWSYLRGDLIAALTMASFYIPMSLSLASNLGHVPAINGLYSFVFNPFLYALLGTCPQMVVGPEAAGSLLTGEVVREHISRGASGEENEKLNAEIAGAVTTMAGGIILAAGLCRLGFLDSVLSRPFLRGFISAIGFVILVDQMIPELGLSGLAAVTNGVTHGSSVDKFVFLVKNLSKAHRLTAAVSLGAFVIIMVTREIKKRMQPKYPSVAYLPDRFIVVVLSAVLAWVFDWEGQGLEVLGNVKTDGNVFQIHFPFQPSHMKYVSDAFNTSLIIALLGFFESSVAAKSLGTREGKEPPAIQNIAISPNRELVALGVANITGGLFMALPAFGGYGRSKVNASTGGRTPMSSIFLSLISLLSTYFLVPYFYYLPKGVLCAMISVVAYSLVEEAPHDIQFFLRIRGWSELFLMLLIFCTTIFWDLKKGVAVGICLSLLRVIRHSTRPRIQILGRVPGTSDKFENAEADPGRVEFIEGCLIVKIPEPLTFANTGDLKNRLRRLENHGTGSAHPALPRVRNVENNKNVIFDVHGVTSLDGAGTQVLHEIVSNYRAKGVRVFFCRVPNERSEVWKLFVASGIVDVCGGREHFLSSVQEALRMTELEERAEAYRDEP